jgi:glycosyltransferase involved in cell wall biosynthesis
VRILVVTPYLPSTGADGGGTVMFNVIRNLSARHEIVCLSFARQQDLPHLAQLEPYCVEVTTVPLPGGAVGSTFSRAVNLVRRSVQNLLSIITFTPVVVWKCMDRAMAHEIRRAVDRHKPDVVHFCFPQMAHYVDACGGVPTVMDTLDVALLGVSRKARSVRPIWAKAYYRMQLLFWVRYESRWFPRFGKVLTVTRQDAAAVKKVLPDLDLYDEAIAVDIQSQPAATQEIGRRIGFLASFGHRPNVDAAIFFTEEVFPLVRQRLPDAEFVVAGKNPPASLLNREGAGISCLGFVEDVPAFYGSVDVAVAPIRYGGGIKIKVLEAMACGKPVVTTSVGAEGIAAAGEEALAVADDPAAIADAVVALLGDPARCRELGEKGRRLVERRFSWGRLMSDLDRIYGELARGRR